MPTGRQARGAYGEERVARWYAEAGYEVAARNWRCAAGEIDLVLTRPGMIVFCEVKARSSDRFGTPAEAVTAAKRRRIRGAAVAYLNSAAVQGQRQMRFDVACVRGTSIEVIESAF